MKTILITADWHIKTDDRIWASRPKIRGDLEVAIDHLLKIIDKIRPVYIFLAGDTFDDRTVSSYSIELFRRFTKVCRQNGCRPYYVLGQHDMSQPPLLSAIDEYCQSLHHRVVDFEGMKIAGLDYCNAPPDRIVDCDCLITHQIWKEFMGTEIGRFSLHLPGLPDLIFSGDFHFPQTVKNENKTLISPGPLIMQAINQDDAKSVVVLDSGGKMWRQAIPSRPVYKFRVVNEETMQILVNFLDRFVPDKTIPEQIREPLILVTTSPDIVTEVHNLTQYPVHIITRLEGEKQSTTTVTENIVDVDLDVLSAIKEEANTELVAQLAIQCYQQQSIDPVVSYVLH